VHILRFICYIFSDRKLKKEMSKIHESSLKWNGAFGKKGFGEELIESLKAKASNRSEKELLMTYVPGFAQSLRLDPQAVKPFFENEKWKDLFAYLFKQKTTSQ